MTNAIHLTQNPYIAGGEYRLPTENGDESIYLMSGAWYEAAAKDDAGNEYMVIWEIRDGFDADTEGDESDACDWDSPRCIIMDGRDVTASVKIA